MLSKEEFEALINKIKGSIDETTLALISEDLLALISTYSTAYDEYAKKDEEIESLKAEKDELLKVNGRLFQKIGFEEEKTEEVEEEAEEMATDELDVEDIIDEKGDIIDE